ncbi:hypothetical protein GCM10027062_02840 [Nocardioides hungaricus]
MTSFDLSDPAFDITQQRPPHHGFGAGMHHCLGHLIRFVPSM